MFGGWWLRKESDASGKNCLGRISSRYIGTASCKRSGADRRKNQETRTISQNVSDKNEWQVSPPSVATGRQVDCILSRGRRNGSHSRLMARPDTLIFQT